MDGERNNQYPFKLSHAKHLNRSIKTVVHNKPDDILTKSLPSIINDNELDSFINEKNQDDQNSLISDCISENASPQSVDPLEINTIKFDEKLYSGSEVSIKKGSLLIYSFMEQNSLSERAREDLLKLIGILLPIGHKLPNTNRKLMTELSFPNEIIFEKRYCAECDSELDTQNRCPKIDCVNFLEIIKDYNMFHYVSIKNQMRILLKNSIESIQSYRTDTSGFIDIINSKHYSSIETNNQLGLLVFADGIELANSSYKNCWPVFITICDLPFSLRNSSSHFVICGSWYGKSKPSSFQLFSCLREEVKNTRNSPISIISSRTGDEFRITLEFYGFIGDTPAKAMLLNMKSHNGYYSCPYCLIEGARCPVYKKTIFPPSRSNQRSHQSYLESGMNAEKSSSPCNGIKGETILSTMIDLPNGLPLDYMHLICLGLFRNLMLHWFDSTNNSRLYYIGNPKAKQLVINNIRKMSFPNSINRHTFDLNHILKWKASEFRNFFFYVALPCLKNILPSIYLWNLACLVFACKILHLPKKYSDIDVAEKLLRNFCKDYPCLYGRQSLSFTFHCVSEHLVQDVRLHGGLAGHSMFGLESTMGLIKSSLNGTRGLNNQFVKRVTRQIYLNDMLLEEFNNNEDSSEMLNQIINNRFNNEKQYIFGKTESRYLNDLEKDHFNIDIFDEILVVEGHRAKIGKFTFHSSMIETSEFRQNCFVHFCYLQQNFHGRILYFFSLNSEIYACVILLTKLKQNLFSDIKGRVKAEIQRMRDLGYFNHLFSIVQLSNQKYIIPVSNILNKCISMKHGVDIFIISDYLNEFEHD